MNYLDFMTYCIYTVWNRVPAQMNISKAEQKDTILLMYTYWALMAIVRKMNVALTP